MKRLNRAKCMNDTGSVAREAFRVYVRIGNATYREDASALRTTGAFRRTRHNNVSERNRETSRACASVSDGIRASIGPARD